MTGVMKGIMQSCFAMGIKGSVRHLSGNRDYSERRKKVIANKRCVSSLVVDKLCDQSKGENTAVTYFYFDLSARKEQSATSILGSLLKQVVGGIEMIPEEITRTFNGEGKDVRGLEPQLPDMMKMLRVITSSLRLYICIDALEGCAMIHRAELLDSLKQILENSLHTRIFITGRPHIRAEIEKNFAGRVITASVSPRKDDISEYLRIRLDEDETPDAMDEDLVREIMEKIPDNMSEMYVSMILGILPDTPS